MSASAARLDRTIICSALRSPVSSPHPSICHRALPSAVSARRCALPSAVSARDCTLPPALFRALFSSRLAALFYSRVPLPLFARFSCLILAALTLTACHPLPPVTGAPVLPSLIPTPTGDTWGTFHTLRAEHRVTISARTPSGTESRTVRGVIAIERPARFRLRALGPGGITLFDLLYTDGKTEVIESLRDPRDPSAQRLLASIGADLALAYDLAPRPPSRACRLDRDRAAIVCTEADRTIRLSDFHRVATGSLPARIEIENPTAAYRVTIESGETTVDEPLDEALFRR